MVSASQRYRESSLLEGSEVQIGGVYPFRTNSGSSLGSRKFILLKSGEACANVRQLRRRVFEPDLRWTDPTEMYEFKATIQSITLTNGRVISEIPSDFIVSLYPTGFGSIIFWFNFGVNTLNAGELIELAALARGTTERIDASKEAVICVSLGNSYYRTSNFADICAVLENDLHDSHAEKLQDNHPRFLHPIVYVGNVAGCTSAQDILRKHPFSLTAISNLWWQDIKSIKEREIDAALNAEVHPFEYGFTIVSQHCTAEYHPKELVEKNLAVEKVSLERHHFVEKTYLSFLIEQPMCRYYALRCFDAELNALNADPILDINSGWDPRPLATLLQRLINVSAVRERLNRGIANFKGPHLRRRNYVQIVEGKYDELLGISELESAVVEKLKALSQAIETGYRTLVALFALFISLIGTTFAIVSRVLKP